MGLLVRRVRTTTIDLLVTTGPETSFWFPAGLILDMIARIESATSEGKDAFLGSQLPQDAVLRTRKSVG